MMLRTALTVRVVPRFVLPRNSLGTRLPQYLPPIAEIRWSPSRAAIKKACRHNRNRARRWHRSSLNSAFFSPMIGRDILASVTG
jgi:hypothetical protein